MPPYIEADSHQDNDWELSATSSQTKSPPLLTHDVPNRDRLDSNDSVPSPLFRDSKSVRTAPTSGGLDRRMSDPEGLVEKASLKDDPLAVTASPPVVSRITAIIGPESAYVKKPTTPSASTTTTNSSSSSSSSTSAASKTTTPKATAAANTKAQPLKSKIKQPSSQTTPPNKNKSQQQNKSTTKPLHIQAQHCIRKKGWKVAITKSLPRKLASSMTISPTSNQGGGATNKKATTSPASAANNRNVI